MGKTHKKVSAHSDSESMFGSPHTRGFARSKKQEKINIILYYKLY